MKAETLKKAILQYAMQGKLVKQNPNDEPALILLERIKAEKEQLIKDGKIKKEKPLSPITEDEIPYELPKGWVWVRLGNIINISSGRFLPSNEMKTKGTIPVYGGNGINGYHNEYLIDKPTLIIGRVGFYCGCVHLSTDKAWVTDNAFITTFSENNVNINFLKWLLIASDLGKNDNATAQPVVSGKKIYPLVVALPPLAEQERIVEKLEQILPLVEEYGKNEEKLSKLNSTLPDKIKQSILQHAVQGKLVPQNSNDEPASILIERIREEKQKLIKEKNESYIFRRDNSYYEKTGNEERCIDDEITFDIPNNWEWVRLGCVINLTSGQDLESSKYNSIQKGIPYITGASNIENEKILINRWTENPKTFAYKGNLLLTCKGTVGTMAFLKEIKVHIARQIMAINTYKSVDLNYLKIYMESYINKLRSVAKSMIPGISRENVLNILFPLPPYNEQQRIVTKVEGLLAVVESLKV